MRVNEYFSFEDGDNESFINGDQVVLVHSNRVCLVGLAPSHPIVRDQVHWGLGISHMTVTTLLDLGLSQVPVRVIMQRLIPRP